MINNAKSSFVSLTFLWFDFCLPKSQTKLKLSTTDYSLLVYLCSPKKEPSSSTLRLPVLVVVNWAKWFCWASFKCSLLMMTVCCTCGSPLLKKCGGNHHKTKYSKFSHVEGLLWLWPLLHLCPGCFMPFSFISYSSLILLPPLSSSFDLFHVLLLSPLSLKCALSNTKTLTHIWLAD